MFILSAFSQCSCVYCVVQGWHEEVLAYQEEIEGLSTLAQQVLEETHISSRVSARATQLTSRYHALLLHLLVRYMHPHICIYTYSTHSIIHMALTFVT